jgi:crossover junction endodeoxyribonuclease RuvC
MKTYVGIDPGKTGAIAFIQDGGNAGPVVAFIDAEGLDIACLGDTIGREAFVLLEKAQVMPRIRKKGVLKFVDGVPTSETIDEPAGQGAVGMFNYGVGYGEYRGMLKTLRIPFAEIHPATWKAAFSLFRQPKERSIAVAKQLFPSISDQLTRKKDHGRAEALLIAEYARRRNM